VKIAVLTSNQPRHLHLVRCLAEVADETRVVIETKSICGFQPDPFAKKPFLKTYFEKVQKAENGIFGDISPTQNSSYFIAIPHGEMSLLPLATLEPIFDADLIIVFGSSYIKGELCEKLISKGTINLHMGISPYYRGAACNFWALYDQNPLYVGATIHLLSKGLDSGAICYHAMPKPNSYDSDPFHFSMRSVKAAHLSLRDKIANSDILNSLPTKPDKANEIRYSKISDFTEVIAEEYLNRRVHKLATSDILYGSTPPQLVNPVYY